MWKPNGSDVLAMLGAGIMLVIATECVVWAITGGYVGF